MPMPMAARPAALSSSSSRLIPRLLRPPAAAVHRRHHQPRGSVLLLFQAPRSTTTPAASTLGWRWSRSRSSSSSSSSSSATPVAASASSASSSFSLSSSSFESRQQRKRQSPSQQQHQQEEQQQHQQQQPRWTVGTSLVLAALASAATFAFDSRSYIQDLWHGGPKAGPQYGSVVDLNQAIDELRRTLGESAISTDDDDLRAHGHSEWSSINVDQLPVAVAYPRSTEDVSKIARVCHRYRVPMIPYSGGSSLEANFSAPYGGMSIDFAFMDRIVAFHDEDMDVVVQPSVQWMALNEHLRPSGLFFPVDPGPSAKIGGMVGTSCSGTNAVRYGTMKEWVINLTVVLADGTVIKTRRRPRKSSAGYNLTGLFVGSEGTLGLVTEATLKLAVIPQETTVGVVTFRTIRDAATAAKRVMREGVPIGAMEIMDEVQMSVVNRAGATGKVWPETPTLFFKFSGTKHGVRDNVSVVRSIARAHGGGDMWFAKDAAEASSLWSARKEALWSMLALRETGRGNEVWSTDVAVPLSRLPDIIEISKREMDELGLFASVLGHIGDGNFHESILYDNTNAREKEAVKRCVHNMVERALQMEGTCTGEHGIGLGKKESLVQELGPQTIDVMRSIKRSLDPHWLMNPGKIFEPEGVRTTGDSIQPLNMNMIEGH